MIIDGLKRLFHTDAFVSTMSVFPDIDDRDIARTLKLRERAREQGGKDLPRTNETSFDAVEMSIIARIEELRRKGLQNYETNKDVYAKRLSRASAASLEVRSVATAAEADFELETKAVRGRLTGLVKNLKDLNTSLLAFQTKHRLDRPAFPPGDWAFTGALILAFLLVETLFNSSLFGQRHELGLLGGALFAVVISIINVSVSGLLGLSTRLLRHISWLGKLLGLIFVAVWLVFLFGFNLGVAHFRDALETVPTWKEAAAISLETALAQPLELNGMDSWLLMLVGMVVAVGAYLKFIFFGESYIGYHKRSRLFWHALDHYVNTLDDALTGLEEKRDDAVQALRDANELVSEKIGDAIDALYGHRMMRSHLVAFLDQCDLKAQTLLKFYRDENRAARASDAPKHFDDVHVFPPFHDAEIDMGHRANAERELHEIGRIVDEAIEAIQASYRENKNRYPDPDILIGVDLEVTDRGSLTRASRSPPEPPATHAPEAASLRAVAGDRLSVVDGARSA